MKKYIALLQNLEAKEYYIQYFLGNSKRDICKKRKNINHRIEAVLNYNRENISKMEYHVKTLNRLIQPHR